MSDIGHKLRFFFTVTFLLSAFTLTFITSSIIIASAQDGATLLLPLSPWLQGIFIVRIILDCTLVFFTTVFYMVATAFGIAELRFQFRRFKQPLGQRSLSSR